MTGGCWHNLRVACDVCVHTSRITRQPNTRCVACGRRTSRLTKDHVVPRDILRKAGIPEGRGGALNIQRICEPCNQKKGNWKAVDYRGDWKLYISLVELMEYLGLNVEIEFVGRPI